MFYDIISARCILIFVASFSVLSRVRWVASLFMTKNLWVRLEHSEFRSKPRRGKSQEDGRDFLRLICLLRLPSSRNTTLRNVKAVYIDRVRTIDNHVSDQERHGRHNKKNLSNARLTQVCLMEESKEISGVDIAKSYSWRRWKNGILQQSKKKIHS